MKTIKVFIASSAELDEDKRQFDLYFSQKNKSYRKRNIDFEQRTWKDFPSHLTGRRLQDSYNDFIKKSDIVIFLFHTRLGQYTLEELDVAYRQFSNSGGKKPKIYIYAKRDESNITILKQIEQFSEKNLGHFCDEYTGYDDLFRHFDYQLEQLENEGFIRPDPVNIPRVLRFVLLSILPLLLAAAGITIANLSRTRTSEILLKESIKTRLPFKGAQLSLNSEHYSRTINLSELDSPVVFTDIPGKDREVRIQFSSKGYRTVDSLVKFSEKITIPIVRDGRAGHIVGQVIDENRFPVNGAKIIVGEYTVLSDENGMFSLDIPLEKQAASYRMTVRKAGYSVWDYNEVSPSENEIMTIMLSK